MLIDNSADAVVGGGTGQIGIGLIKITDQTYYSEQ
jgi:hypothetical protein